MEAPKTVYPPDTRPSTKTSIPSAILAKQPILLKMDSGQFNLFKNGSQGTSQMNLSTELDTFLDFGKSLKRIKPTCSILEIKENTKVNHFTVQRNLFFAKPFSHATKIIFHFQRKSDLNGRAAHITNLIRLFSMMFLFDRPKAKILNSLNRQETRILREIIIRKNYLNRSHLLQILETKRGDFERLLDANRDKRKEQNIKHVFSILLKHMQRRAFREAPFENVPYPPNRKFLFYLKYISKLEFGTSFEESAAKFENDTKFRQRVKSKYIFPDLNKLNNRSKHRSFNKVFMKHLHVVPAFSDEIFGTLLKMLLFFGTEDVSDKYWKTQSLEKSGAVCSLEEDFLAVLVEHNSQEMIKIVSNYANTPVSKGEEPMVFTMSGTATGKNKMEIRAAENTNRKLKLPNSKQETHFAFIDSFIAFSERLVKNSHFSGATGRYKGFGWNFMIWREFWT